MSLYNLETLYRNFSNPDSTNFGSINVEEIFENAKHDASQHPVSRREIEQLQLSLESLSKGYKRITISTFHDSENENSFSSFFCQHHSAKERRLLKGKKRKISFRKWIFHAPRHTLLGKQVVRYASERIR